MKNQIIQAVLAMGIIKFTDINEEFLCETEARKIKNEVENAMASFKRGLINQLEFQKVIFRNQQKIDDVLVEWA